MKKLNGWKRLGVVLSVIWMPIGLFYGSGQAIEGATWQVSGALRACLERNASGMDTCDAAYTKDWAVAVAQSHHWWWGIAGAVIPIVVCWLLAWALVATVRWVMAGGFKAS